MSDETPVTNTGGPAAAPRQVAGADRSAAADTPLTSEGVPAPVQTEFGLEDDGDALIDGKVGMVEQVADRAGIIGELFGFLWANKLWWMVPMVAILLVFGLLMVFASSSPVGAFIYTLF